MPTSWFLVFVTFEETSHKIISIAAYAGDPRLATHRNTFQEVTVAQLSDFDAFSSILSKWKFYKNNWQGIFLAMHKINLRSFFSNPIWELAQSTKMCGAENKTATVVIIVKVVKIIKQNLKAKTVWEKSLNSGNVYHHDIWDNCKRWILNFGNDLSMTMAANFQSDSISFSLSIVFKRLVIKRSSWKYKPYCIKPIWYKNRLLTIW